mgnify:CR=1 FL=1
MKDVGMIDGWRRYIEAIVVYEQIGGRFYVVVQKLRQASSRGGSLMGCRRMMRKNLFDAIQFCHLRGLTGASPKVLLSYQLGRVYLKGGRPFRGQRSNSPTLLRRVKREAFQPVTERSSSQGSSRLELEADREKREREIHHSTE